MSRRRYISSGISTDVRVNKLANLAGDFAVLLYTWMIPHAADDGTLTGDPEELLATVVPMRRDKQLADVVAALTAMEVSGLILWERDGLITFPLERFYKYQTYIPKDKQRNAILAEEERGTPRKTEEDRKTPVDTEQRRTTPNNAEDYYTTPILAEKQRETPNNTTSRARAHPSLSPSPDPSPSHLPSLSVDGESAEVSEYQEKYTPRHNSASIPESVEAVIRYFIANSQTEECAIEFYGHYQANGWVQGGTMTPIMDWHAQAGKFWRKAARLQKEGVTLAEDANEIAAQLTREKAVRTQK